MRLHTELLSTEPLKETTHCLLKAPAYPSLPSVLFIALSSVKPSEIYEWKVLIKTPHETDLRPAVLMDVMSLKHPKSAPYCSVLISNLMSVSMHQNSPQPFPHQFLDGVWFYPSKEQGSSFPSFPWCTISLPWTFLAALGLLEWRVLSSPPLSGQHWGDSGCWECPCQKWPLLMEIRCCSPSCTKRKERGSFFFALSGRLSL